MIETRYGKYVIKAPIQPAKMGPPLPSLRFSAVEHGVDANWSLVPVIGPRIMHEVPIKHDFPQFLFFLGSDPRNIGELGAEIEVTLGEEAERHTVTSPTVLHISPGLVHCPLNFKRVDKPVLHLDIYFSPEYIYTEVNTTTAKAKKGENRYANHIIKAPFNSPNKVAYLLWVFRRGIWS
jgi:hypothetical protein